MVGADTTGGVVIGGVACGGGTDPDCIAVIAPSDSECAPAAAGCPVTIPVANDCPIDVGDTPCPRAAGDSDPPGIGGGAALGGGGMGMPMGAAHQGQGGAKSKGSQQEDEALYTEDRAWTEAVIGNRRRQDSKESK